MITLKYPKLRVPLVTAWRLSAFGYAGIYLTKCEFTGVTPSHSAKRFYSSTINSLRAQ